MLCFNLLAVKRFWGFPWIRKISVLHIRNKIRLSRSSMEQQTLCASEGHVIETTLLQCFQFMFFRLQHCKIKIIALQESP